MYEQETNWQNCILHAGLFGIFALLHSSRLKCAQTCLCTNEITQNIEIRKFLSQPAYNEGKWGENKTETNIFLCIVIKSLRSYFSFTFFLLKSKSLPGFISLAFKRSMFIEYSNLISFLRYILRITSIIYDLKHFNRLLCVD